VMRAAAQAHRGGSRKPGRARAALPLAAGVGVSLALTVAIAACGSQPGSQSATPVAVQTAAAPSATPAPRPLVAVLDHPFGTVANTLRLLRSDGIEVAATTVPASAEAIAMAGRRVLIAADGVIQAFDEHGGIAAIERLAPADPTDLVRGIIAAPDGSTWLWTVLHRDADGSLHSRVYLGAQGAEPRLVLDRPDPDHALTPLMWSPAGPVVADDEVGIGGYILFRRSFGPASRIDIDHGSLIALSPADCALSDLAADGTVACVADGREGPHGAGPVTLRLVSSTTPRQLTFTPDVVQAGAAYFSPDGEHLTVASSPALGSDAEQVATEVVDLPTLARHTLGTGLVPVGWLDAATIVASRQQGFAGGDPGTYLLRLDGTSSLVSTASGVIGIAAA
jgi:hypothetical protein